MYIASLRIEPVLIQKVKDAQEADSAIGTLRKETEQGLKPRFRVHDDGLFDSEEDYACLMTRI